MATMFKTLENGAYTAADASRILKIPYPKAKYWFKNYARTKFSEDEAYGFSFSNIQAVNFFALIEMYVFYTLKEKGITTSKILQAHQVMCEFLGTPYPFAKEDIFVSNNNMLLFGNESSQVITADRKLQTVIIKVLKPFLNKIQFNDDKLAHKFYPLGRKRAIVVNPDNQFGQPVVDGTNILTQTIKSFHMGGESAKSIAKLFNLNIRQVKDAIEFATAA